MDNSPLQKKILISLTSMSKDLDAMSSTTESAPSKDQLRVLHSKLADMKETIDGLRDDIKQYRAPAISDDALAIFKTNFSSAIATSPGYFLVASYDIRYFADLAENLRVAVAECLIARFNDLGTPAPSFLNRIISTDGAM